MLTLGINVKNLVDNIELLKGKTSAEFCAVVKANAYGHGIAITKFIDDHVDSYAVAFGDEAARLRRLTRKKIYVLCPSEDIGDKNVVYSAFRESDLRAHKRICIKINSGMNRLGLLPSVAESFIRRCISRGVSIDSLYTHFSDVENAETQFKAFMQVGGDFKRHCCASNFLKLDSRFHLDMVRCGLVVYGYGDTRLKPVLSAFADVYNVVSVKKGEKIGYSRTADRDMKVAILGAGYADCIKRQPQKFYIDGKVCETVGNICMDMCLLDVSGLDVSVGDRAEYIGANITAEEVAKNNNTIAYEILSSLNERCRRIYE